MKKTLLLLVFVLLLAIWTWKLLDPTPVPDTVTHGLNFTWHFLLAKSLHASVYAVLAFLGITRFPRHRITVIVLLMLHGAGTELAQHLMKVGRTGKVTDVLLDWIGISVEWLIASWWSRRNDKGQAKMTPGRMRDGFDRKA